MKVVRSTAAAITNRTPINSASSCLISGGERTEGIERDKNGRREGVSEEERGGTVGGRQTDLAAGSPGGRLQSGCGVKQRSGQKTLAGIRTERYYSACTLAGKQLADMNKNLA